MRNHIRLLTNILVVGSGAREHSLGWKLSQSEHVDDVFYAPGNGGTKNNIPINVEQIEELADFASKNDCFTVVGPEVPLALGIVDTFMEKNLKIFGPTQNAAKLESSKIWAKNFMNRNEIPTAKFKIFDEPNLAKEYIESVSFPLVIKADGLAAGKGVIVCDTTDEALSAADKILVEKSFGEAGKRIIVEERIDGIEASYIALSDGETVIPLATSQDHKRIHDDDKGSNTGGMGAYSPTGAIDDILAEKIQTKIIRKTVDSLKKEGIVFKGFLYAGVMIQDGEPYVLEFNARMGDPECQPMVIRMNSDLFEYLTAVADGNLSSLPSMSWKKQSAVCVVLASNGYPESYSKNEEIVGLSDIPKNSFVFHAGTKDVSGKIVTNGGRVLSVTSLGDSLQDAISNTYKAAEKISWPSKYYRHDIGKKGLSYL